MSNALSLTSPTANAMSGMDGSHLADIPMTGQYTFTGTGHIAASFDNWVTQERVATVTTGTAQNWSGTLHSQPAGPRGTVRVRFEEDTATTASVAVGIGWIILYVGDSKVQDYYTNTDTYSAVGFGVSVKPNNSTNDADWLEGNSAADKSPGL